MATTRITQARIEEIPEELESGPEDIEPQPSKGKQHADQPLGDPTPGPSGSGGGGDDPGDNNPDPDQGSNGCCSCNDDRIG